MSVNRTNSLTFYLTPSYEPRAKSARSDSEGLYSSSRSSARASNRSGDFGVISPWYRSIQTRISIEKTRAYTLCMKYEIKSKSFSNISDDELLRRLSELLHKSRRVEAELVAHIGEVDVRRLYAREAGPSMFSYCTERLNLSEHEAYLRIGVARAARRHPMLLDVLAEGRLPLSAIARLAPHLTEGNRDAVLARAAGKSKREIEELIAELSPKPDVPSIVHKLPERRVKPRPVSAAELVPERVTFLHTPVAASSTAPAKRPVVEPLSPILSAVIGTWLPI